MILKILIKNDRVVIQLYNEKQIIDEISFPEAKNMSEKLLPSIDKILRKNNISIKSIKQIYLESQMAESFTSYRIAKATTDSLNYLISCG
jgi:tRNA A37 threonylcarbamoyladenosine modification protein TsaB